MKNIGLLFLTGALLLISVPTVAQLDVQAKLDRDTYVRYEPINLTITLRNNSGNTVAFGGGDGGGATAWGAKDAKPAGYLRLEIKDQQGVEVELVTAPRLDPDNGGLVKYGKKGFNPVRELTLPAGSSKSITLKANSYYKLDVPGNYRVRVIVGHERLNEDWASPNVFLKVVEGTTQWQREVGLPSPASADAIETRLFRILAVGGNEGATYCLQVEDKNFVYNVVRLGPKVSGVFPQFEVDARSRVHVMFQTHARLFTYWIYDYTLNLKQQTCYLPEPTVPGLIRDPDLGRVMVAGGTLAIEGVDYNVVNAGTMMIDDGTQPQPRNEVELKMDKEPPR